MNDNSKLYLFAIGGTGARVVRSFTMMLASGIDGLNSTIQVVPIIIDYDLSNGDKTRTMKLLEKYNEINNQLYPNVIPAVKYDDNYFMTRITSLRNVGVIGANAPQSDYQMFFGTVGQTQKFSDFIDVPSMRTNPQERETLDLLNCLYDNSPTTSSDAELELDLTVGFKGNPNIGSVVFNAIDQTNEFATLVGNFAAGDRIMIVSSIFGGTGSSGFPELVKAIRRCNNNPALSAANIGAVVVLPYFGLQNPPAGAMAAVDATSFNAKARAALSYYATRLNDQVNSLYYVGDENHDSIEFHEGSTLQINPAHVVEFVGATAIVDFMLKNDGVANHAYEFGVKDGKIGSAINYRDFYQGSQNEYINRLAEFAFAMRFYRDVVCGDRAQVSSNTAYYTDFNLSANIRKSPYKEISEFLGSKEKDPSQYVADDWGFFAWIRELVQHNHKLSMFDLSINKDMRHIYTHHGEEGFHVTGFNPVKDDKLNDKMNNLSNNLPNHNPIEFFKIIRTMSHDMFDKMK